jgi:hypothetical protein
MKNFITICNLLTICVTVGISCRSKEFTEQDKQSLNQLLMENEKIHSFLMKTEGGLPSLQGVQEALDLLGKSENSEISSKAEKMKLNLREIKGIQKEEDFKQFSLFSENLSQLAKDLSIEEINKFYCPMEDKYWVAKGRRIENPYSPEMRDCGSLVEQN